MGNKNPINDPLVSSGNIDDVRERLVFTLLYIFSGIFLLVFIVIIAALFTNKILFENSLTLFLAATSAFSGFLGTAIGFYFSSK